MGATAETPIRVAMVGFGTVGRWLARAAAARSPTLAERYGLSISFVGIGTERHGYVHAPDGLDLGAALAAPRDRPLGELGDTHWPTAAEGLRATEADVVVEVTGSRGADGEPGLTHIREALERGVPVVTSNKWPIALAGVELAALARARGTALRAEATVMSGTPVLRCLREGLAGAEPVGARGVLNATVNFVLTEMAGGSSYAAALAAAQRAGLAERDPQADVDGHDSVAKLMILSALAFGRQLDIGDVECRGISDLTEDERDATRAGAVREVTTLKFAEPGGRGEVSASVGPAVLGEGDPLASATGTTCALACRAEPIGEVTLIGPGAGPQLAGQGVLSDLISVALSR